MSETIGITIFVAVFFGFFYYLARRAEKQLREKARLAREEQEAAARAGAKSKVRKTI